jgi:hypothetical protein
MGTSTRRTIADAIAILMIGPLLLGLIDGSLGLLPAIIAGITVLFYPEPMPELLGGISGAILGFWAGSHWPVQVLSAHGRRLLSKSELALQYSFVAGVSGVAAGWTAPMIAAQSTWLGKARFRSCSSGCQATACREFLAQRSGTSAMLSY